MNSNFSIRFQVVRENNEPAMPGIFGNNTVIEISNNTLDNSPLSSMYTFASNIDYDTSSYVMSRLFELINFPNLEEEFINESLNYEQPGVEKATSDMLKELGPYKRIRDGDQLLENECIICTDKYQKDEGVRELPCNHVFHKRCIDKWFKEGSVYCPICRKNPFNLNN